MAEQRSDAAQAQCTTDSPCVSVCALDENDICMGCYRSAEEITDWFTADQTKKLAILVRAATRREEDSPIKLL